MQSIVVSINGCDARPSEIHPTLNDICLFVQLALLGHPHGIGVIVVYGLEQVDDILLSVYLCVQGGGLEGAVLHRHFFDDVPHLRQISTIECLEYEDGQQCECCGGLCGGM